MALYLTEEEVARLLPMREALRLVEESFLAQQRGQSIGAFSAGNLMPRSSPYWAGP